MTRARSDSPVFSVPSVVVWVLLRQHSDSSDLNLAPAVPTRLAKTDSY
jgi:hypothetical protein